MTKTTKCKKTYAVGPVTGEGATQTAARIAAETRAAVALDRLNEAPIIFQWGSTAVTVAPSLYGWGYWWASPTHPRGRLIAGPFGTRDEALYAAIFHVAYADVTAKTTATEITQIVHRANAILVNDAQAAALSLELTDRAAWLLSNEAEAAQGDER